jgi:predicted RNA-binding Zn ribbon-like protein
MPKTGEMRTSDWKDGFLFVGNQVALDFLNTRPIQDGEPKELLGDFKSLLLWFRAAELVSSRVFTTLQQWDGSSPAQRALEKIRGFREELRKEILRWETGGKLHHATIEKLNSLLALHPMLARVIETGSGPRVNQYFEALQPEGLFAPLIYGAAKLFTETDRSRVRKCGNCVLHFWDTSKKGTRRWCSMQLCGNRLKVAAYACRQLKGDRTINE